MPVDDAPWNRPPPVPQDGSAPEPSQAAPAPVGSVDPTVLRAQYEELRRSGEQDRAWCTAAALVFLGAADEAQARYHADYRSQGMLAVQVPLTTELWSSCLHHPGEDLLISKLVEAVTPTAVQLRIEQLAMQRKLPVLDPRFRQDPVTSTITFAKVFGWAAVALGVFQPDLYVRSDVPGTLLAIPAIPLASIAGKGVLAGFTPVELAFLCGCHLAYYRAEHYVTCLFPDPEEFVPLVLAASVVANPSAPVPAHLASKVETVAQAFAARMQPVQLEMLRMLTRRMAEKQTEPDVQAWRRAVDFTVCRAGLLLGGDLDVARRVLEQERQAPGAPSLSERLEDLLRFSVSEQYSRLRQHLGIAVGATQGGARGERPTHQWAENLNALAHQLPRAAISGPGAQSGSSAKLLLVVALVIAVAGAVLGAVLAGK